jgi:general secretion pathway protein M
MSATSSTLARSGRREWLALLIYLVLLVGLTMFAVTTVSSLLDSYAALNASQEMLAHLDRQLQHSASSQSAPGSPVDGPPFLTGKTITVAGAGLQERVEAAVKRAGGNVLSSQIDLQGPRAAEGFVCPDSGETLNSKAAPRARHGGRRDLGRPRGSRRQPQA